MRKVMTPSKLKATSSTRHFWIRKTKAVNTWNTGWWWECDHRRRGSLMLDLVEVQLQVKLLFAYAYHPQIFSE